EVVVQPRGPMLLYDKAARSRLAKLRWRLGRLLEIAFAFIFLERHGELDEHRKVRCCKGRTSGRRFRGGQSAARSGAPRNVCYNNEIPRITWALNSAVECHLHTVEVIGSNPIAPTISFQGFTGIAPDSSNPQINPHFSGSANSLRNAPCAAQ